MKIALISPELTRDGGLQVVLLNMMEALEKKYGVHCDVITPLGKMAEQCGGYGAFSLDKIAGNRNVFGRISARIFWALSRRLGFFRLAMFRKIACWSMYSKKQYARLIDFFNSGEYDAVIGVADKYIVLTAVISRQLSMKSYGWAHSTFDAYYNKRGFASFGLDKILRYYGKGLTSLFVLTEKDRRIFREKCNVNSVVLHNSHFLAEQPEKKEFPKKVLWVGRLTRKVKGLDYLASVIEKTIEKDPIVRFFVVGRGTDREYFERELKKRKIDTYVTLEGYKKDLSTDYAENGLLISTSRWEGFGLTLIEAMRFGLPVVSFDNDGPTEIVKDGETGILVKKYDIGAFADAICLIFGDIGKWKYMSERARQDSSCYNEEIITEFFYSQIKGD